MKISKALKKKNKLVKELQVFLTRAQQTNSIIEGKTRYYEPRKMIDLANEKLEELVSLKTKISVANQPIQSKIYKLSELKSLLTNIREISTDEGPNESSSFYREQNKIIIYTSEIKTVEIDQMVKNIENEIESIQDELDVYNNTTEI